jgi:PII-like signaling protein
MTPGSRNAPGASSFRRFETMEYPLNYETLTTEFGGSAGLRLRIYLGERDHHGGQPLYTAIVDAARKAGLGGATVFKGIEGFGSRSVVHAARVMDMSSDLPIVVEFVDLPDAIRTFVGVLWGMLDDGMMTVEPVAIIYQNAGSPRS